MIGLVIGAGIALADEPEVTVEAQARPRAEAHTGRDNAEGGEVWFIVQRTRLGATARMENLSARAVVQDVRLFGEEANTLTDFSADGLDLHFGYLQWDGEGASLRLGRQEFLIHEDRLIGNVGWLQQARAFDGARLWTSGDDVPWNLDVGAAITANPLAEAHEGDAGVAYALLGYHKASMIDLVYILDAAETRERAVHTAGVYAKSKPGILSGRAEGYYQFGQTDGLTVQAFLVGVRGTLAPEVATKPKFTLWYDYMSGNSGEDGIKGLFDTMYATNHKFYGLTDVVWFTVGGAADGRGLQDAALKLSMVPARRVTLKAEAHVFLAAQDPDDDMVIGAEPDVTVAWRAARNLTVSAGAGVFIPNQGETESWGFMMVDANL
ncbi:MAG: alginate export family protein [Myxococcota bacterium]